MLNLNNIIKYTHGLKLLYVEDNELARESTISILEELFTDIFIGCDGEEGLELFKNNDIDLIITDINMPKMNGLEMAQEIRKSDKDVAILVLSAYNESSFFLESIKMGIDGYLLKPIDMTQFMDMLQKVTQKLKLKDELAKNLHLMQQYQEATDKSAIVSKGDLKGDITYANDEFCEVSGYTREELIGKPHSVVRHPENPSSMFEEMWETIEVKKSIWQGIVRNIKKNGDSYYVKTIIKPILDQDGEIIEYISLRDNITDVMSQKKQLEDMIDFNKESILALIKIENFDDIERFYGSKLSRKIEDEFSKYILQEMPKACKFDKVFLLDEGEYAFVKDKTNYKVSMPLIAKNLKDFQSTIDDVTLDVGEIDYDISILISFAYGYDVLENAKYGLKKILESGQEFILANNLVQKEQVEARNNLQTLKMVKKAIDNHKIVSYFQPIINNKTKKIEKYESLVRLIDEDDKVLSPFFFLDAAKKGKYYSQITEIVLQNSFDALHITDVDISMNLSMSDIEKSLTRHKIFDLLKANSQNNHRVIFELLEDDEKKDFSIIKSFIQDVKKMGVRIAVDDFGVGYSNFERLLDYQPDILKLDGGLIKNIERDTYSLNVVETIISFAKKQNIQTVAEFVESENIFNILKEIGVDYSQGYYFGKPEVLK